MKKGLKNCAKKRKKSKHKKNELLFQKNY